MRTALRISGFWGESGLEHWRADGGDGGLFTILPSRLAALQALGVLIHMGREQESKRGNKSLFSQELDDDTAARRRFARRWGYTGRWSRFGPLWGRGMSLAYALVPFEMRARVLAVLSAVRIFAVVDDADLLARFKVLTTVAKKYGEILFPTYWKWLVNWETLGGFRPPLPMKEFVPELISWVTGDIRHTAPSITGTWSEEEFLSLLGSGMAEFLNLAPSIGLANQTGVTIEEFASSPGYWARAGASSTRCNVRYRTAGGEWANARKSKWRTGLALSPGAVGAILREDSPVVLRQQNKAMQKREPAKLRGIISSDDGTYLRMAYVARWLESALSGHPNSTLFMSTRQLATLWIDIAQQCKSPMIKTPLDMAHFDWQQNLAMLAVFCDVARAFITLHACPRLRSDLLQVLARVRVALVDVPGYLFVRDGSCDQVITITKGVMSGWRWTALMDTVFNWGQLYAARMVLKRGGFSEPVLSAVAQGDDDRIVCPSYGHAAGLVLAFKSMNFEIKASKFFLSSTRDEFLRKVAEPGLVSGYGVRGVNTLLWRGPTTRDPPAGLLRLTGILKSWNTVLGRGGDPTVINRLLRRDLAGASGLSAPALEALLATPAAMGGLGFLPAATSGWVSYSPGEVRAVTSVLVADVHGLSSELDTWQRLGSGLTITNALAGLIANLDLPKAKLLVTAAVVSPVGYLRPYTWSPTTLSAGVPLQAYSHRGLPPTLLTVARDVAIRAHNWHWLESVWLDPDLRVFSRRLASRGGRHVWVDWLTGSLPWHLPTSPAWGDLLPSVVYHDLVRACWSRVVSYSSFNYTSVRRAALTAEYALHVHLQKAGCRITD